MTIRARACGARSRCRRFYFTYLTALKTEKTAVFALIRLRNHRRFPFFGYLFKLFLPILYAQLRLARRCTGASAFASLFYRCPSASLRTEKDKAREAFRWDVYYLYTSKENITQRHISMVISKAFSSSHNLSHPFPNQSHHQTIRTSSQNPNMFPLYHYPLSLYKFPQAILGYTLLSRSIL